MKLTIKIEYIMTNKKILLGLTTTRNSDWKEKINEIKRYNIENIALFLTGIETSERKQLYKLLATTNIKSIYHVHLRSDMTTTEMQYLIDTYDVQAFNTHTSRSNYPFENLPVQFKNITYIENTLVVPTKQEMKNYGGLCIDFSHWEAYKFLHRKEYSQLESVANDSVIGCCHVSAVYYYGGLFPYAKHTAKGENGFNYLRKYIKYLPQHISLELENSFVEQLKYKKYIEELSS